MTETTRRIIEAIRAVPAGKVCSYRDAARAAGLPNGARQTARVLHSMAESEGLPWHRIIRSDGSIALKSGNGRELQIKLLRSEGVVVSKDGRVTVPPPPSFPLHTKRCGVPRRPDGRR
ncbi:MAG: MGMT family protein [Treponema sp.]|nr:MGMT family protein [Treponema sp.]